MNRDAEVIQLLSDLVAIDSTNPSLYADGAGERQIANFVAEWGESNGLHARLIDSDSARPSVVVATAPEAGHGPALLICGHLDTVGPGGMDAPWTPRIDGDRLYGRGAYDMKAGLAAGLIAARDANRAGIGGRVVVAAVADEEHSSTGIQETLNFVQANAAIVCEPTEMVIAEAHKGFVWIEIDVTGVSAHGSRPHLGRDAVFGMGPILSRLRDLDREIAVRSQHSSLGSGNLHGSTIIGGREESTIPDRCTLVVERRTLPGEQVADIEREIRAVLDACRNDDPDLAVQMRTTMSREPFERVRGDDLLRSMDNASARLGNLPLERGSVSYWADSAFIQAAGVPTVLLGPAGDGAHADIEWVSVSSTVACTRVLTATAIDYCQ
ncbi:M20/M25/M40 family metallo-hydrolase [Mycolicibacterium sp. YH-1]|uniref:M20/M25/M40 family metallo-hydrolase n=1 Tax=Mycolicibacterium sp. YH-1 TaxID=2908837 RepID=UPI001F4C3A62|nr:M20/M25/M40 family metallo-hydrolase [Mycolicibacterium sp. YH-1]UNB52883.1 M20/M25/M40 family metallo-hydrolase [Mycolicibacterium sp. YH-1]